MAKIIATLILLVGLLVSPAGTTPSAEGEKPPSVHVDAGACPFECCTYREWVARTDVMLLDSPNSKRVVGRIKKGETVLALTGEVHSVPLRVVVQQDYPEISVKAGDTIYVLHYMGEGYWRVWHDGKLGEIQDFPGNGAKPKTTWWVQLKTPSGVVGWTVERRNFDNQDRCG
jgi:hypothetical protein